MNKETLNALAKEIILSLKNDDFAFTVESRNMRWDVYRFGKGEKRGMIALSMDEAQENAIIGMLKLKELTEAEVKAFLDSAKPD